MTLNITTVTSNNIPVVPKGSTKNDNLDQTDFLRLMTTQLKYQDPLAPTDNQQMVAQMAQFSSVAGISEMNDSLRDIAEMISTQTGLLEEIRAASSTAASTPGAI